VYKRQILYYIEGKAASEIAKMPKTKEENIPALINRSSTRLLHNFRYLNSRLEKAKIVEEKYWELLRQFEDQKVQLDYVIDELNKVKPNSISREKATFLNTKLIDFDLSVRLLNCLKYAEIDTVSQLLQIHSSDLLKFRNFGKKSFHELKDFLESHGYKLKK
jgi:DNA-directed RNA polymerase alpha subunit